jgi:tRNA-modifying protein YgfZ
VTTSVLGTCTAPILSEVVTHAVEREVDALERGAAYAELEGVVITLVSGHDARAWLNDLVTTEVETLERFVSRPSLLLSPTGRIRASFHVLGLGDRDLALAQPAGQPASIAELLAPYVLSSDVTISSSRLRLFAVPGREHPPAWLLDAWRPSILNGGFDLIVGASDEAALDDVRDRLRDDGLVPAGHDSVQARRIAQGVPAFPTDVDGESLPAEAGWDVPPVTDRTKGCFLGQEAVAKVANLGHPTRIVLPVTADRGARAGEAVLASGIHAGRVTSAYGRSALVRVGWDAREMPLSTASGATLLPR